MCTVSFIPRCKGYALAMNRDEQLSRVTGLPPAEKILAGVRVLGPAEPGGGTWINVNEHGTTFALINWYAVTARAAGTAISRGGVVNAVSAASNPAAAEAALNRLPMPNINPFRLIGVFPAHQEIVQWGWDLQHLRRNPHPWRAAQWISSGLDEPAAQTIRSATFQAALPATGTPGLPWLRRQHASHTPERGAFSTCMHRADAATVSYTEIVLTGRQATMKYIAGAPCLAGPAAVFTRTLPVRGVREV